MRDRCDGRATVGDRTFEFDIRVGDEWGLDYRFEEVGGSLRLRGTCPDLVECLECVLRHIRTLERGRES